MWSEEGPTLMDLDNQEPSTSSSNNQDVTMALELRKNDPSENEVSFSSFQVGLQLISHILY